MLGEAKIICYHEGLNPRGIRSSSTISINFYPIRRKLASLEPMAEILGGTLKKKSLNTIPFTLEMRTLAYIMLSNLYLVSNLTTLSGPRTIFLYDLFIHKEIDICGHIDYLLTKSITKRNLRTILPFPSLIMALIAKTRLKQSYHHVKGLFDCCSNGDPKQSPHHRTKNQHFSNPNGQY